MDLALGTAQLGQDYGITGPNGSPSGRQVKTILRTAWRNGVRRFDTAASYGQSEARLGDFFRDLPGDAQPAVVSKISLPPAAEVESRHRNSIDEAVKGCLERLGLARLHGLLVHNPDVLDREADPRWRRLESLRETGRVDNLGVSVYDPRRLIRLADRLDLDVVQCPVNVFDRRFLAPEVRTVLSDPSLEVWARSCFLQGVMFLDEDELPSFLSDLEEPLRTFHDRLATENGLTVECACMAFLRRQSCLDVLVVGVDSAEQLVANLRAFERDLSRSTGRRLTADLPLPDAHQVDPRNW